MKKVNHAMISKGIRPLIFIENFEGECHNCHLPLNYPGKMLVVPTSKSKEGDVTVMPMEFLECPNCHSPILSLVIYGDRLFGKITTQQKKAGLN